MKVKSIYSHAVHTLLFLALIFPKLLLAFPYFYPLYLFNCSTAGQWEREDHWICYNWSARWIIQLQVIFPKAKGGQVRLAQNNSHAVWRACKGCCHWKRIKQNQKPIRTSCSGHFSLCLNPWTCHMVLDLSLKKLTPTWGHAEVAPKFQNSCWKFNLKPVTQNRSLPF